MVDAAVSLDEADDAGVGHPLDAAELGRVLAVGRAGGAPHVRSYLPVGAAVGGLVLLEMVLVILSGTKGAGSGAAPAAGSNTKALGRLIYVDYVYPFEIAAVVLLVAIIAAIALTHRKRRESKYQDPAQQVKVRRQDRVRLLDLPAEKKE